MNAVTYHPGSNIVDDDADILVCTVNCVGVMGKGVAKAFAERWPEIVAPYRRDCERGLMRPGGCALRGLPNGRLWAALTTKDHWRYPSRIEWVDRALETLAEDAADASVRSIAIPPPGCGNGGLNWVDVEPLVLRRLSDFDLRIYAQSTLPVGDARRTAS